MNQLKGSNFVKALLAQEPMLDGDQFDRHREKLLECLALVELREKRSRRVVIAATVVAIIVLSCIFAFALPDPEQSKDWPEWLVYTLAMAVILFPFCAFLLAGIYFLRHWRELRRTRDQVYRSGLLDLRRQTDQLRREVTELRRELKARGFTLMEMLVTVAVLGILTSLLLPALSQAKQRARSIQCISNLSQIGKALLMYEGQEHAYPGAGSPVREINGNWTRTDDSWDGRILPFLASVTNVFVCPSHPLQIWAPQIPSDSYGYNAGGTCAMHDFTRNLGLGYGAQIIDGIEVPHEAVRSAAVKSPAEMIGIGDLQMPLGLWINTITPNVQPQTFGGMKSAVASRHRGGANMLFCDGHTEFANQPLWIVPNDETRRRWNNDHEPHSETWR